MQENLEMPDTVGTEGQQKILETPDTVGTEGHNIFAKTDFQSRCRLRPATKNTLQTIITV